MTGTPTIIPRPAELSLREGALAVASIGSITADRSAALGVAERFRTDLVKWAGLDLGRPTVGARTRIDVRVEMRGNADSGVLSPESATADGAHTVTIDGSGILVRSESAEGLHRGLTTVVQLIGTTDGDLTHLRIADTARYGWRGLSLDTARAFVPVDEIRRVIDVVSLYKLDVLHLHLSDNEGWRMELPGWPRLTSATDGTERRFYTAADLAELTHYAAERFVTIVPEIDLPGHVGAAIRAYPELNAGVASELDRPFPRANLDPDSAAAWRFVDDVIDTLAALTSGPYLHVGGDEAFGMDDAAHESFVEHILERAAAHGKIPIGWQEISRARVEPGQLVQHWIDFSGAEDDDAASADPDEAGAAAADLIPAEILAELTANFRKAAADARRIAEKGVRVVLSPNGHAYLDRPHLDRSLDPDQRPEDIGLPYYPPTPLAAYLEWDPATVTPTIPADRIVGVEAALWAENAATGEARGALLLPRLPAVAEVAWSAGVSEWHEYRDRLARHSVLWERAGVPWFQADSVPWRRPATVAR